MPEAAVITVVEAAVGDSLTNKNDLWPPSLSRQSANKVEVAGKVTVKAAAAHSRPIRRNTIDFTIDFMARSAVESLDRDRVDGGCMRHHGSCEPPASQPTGVGPRRAAPMKTAWMVWLAGAVTLAWTAGAARAAEKAVSNKKSPYFVVVKSVSVHNE